MVNWEFRWSKEITANSSVYFQTAHLNFGVCLFQFSRNNFLNTPANNWPILIVVVIEEFHKKLLCLVSFLRNRKIFTNGTENSTLPFRKCVRKKSSSCIVLRHVELDQCAKLHNNSHSNQYNKKTSDFSEKNGQLLYSITYL